MGNQKKFLKSLFDILSNEQFHHIICWSDDGVAIVMKSPKHFEEQVMSEYFNSTKVSTFYRQLNQYGFKFKQNKQKEKMFWHDQFNKDNKFSLFTILSNQCSVVQRRKRIEQEDQDNLLQENKRLSIQLKLLQKQQQQIQAQLSIHTHIYAIICKQLQNIHDYCIQDPDCTEGEEFFKAIISVFVGFRSEIAQTIIEDLKFIGGPQTPQLSPILFPYSK